MSRSSEVFTELLGTSPRAAERRSLRRREVTIQELGSLGELIVAIATVVTLAYLAIQIRANTNAIRSESRGRISGQTQGYSAVIGGSKEAASIFMRGLADLNSLHPEEQTQFSFLFTMIVNQAHDSHHEYRLGITDREVFSAHSSSALRLLRTPGGKDYWRHHRSDFSLQFQEFVQCERGETTRS